jgi:hypothetical protein
MIAQHAVDPTLPGLDDVIKLLRAATFRAPFANAYEQEIRRATSRVLVERLMELAGSAPMPQVRAIASAQLRSIAGGEAGGAVANVEEGAARALMAEDIKRFLQRPIAPIATPDTPAAPPGAPIGDPGMDWLARVEWCRWGG